MVYEDNNPGVHEFKKEGDELEGVLINIQDNVGPQNSMLYTLEVDEKPVNVWGCVILDQRMIGTKIGNRLKIIFKGLGEAQPFKKPPKIFQVLVDREPKEDPKPEKE